MTMLADPPAPVEAPHRITIREYFSAQSDQYTKTDAKRIGPELERLAAEGKTKLRDVVDAARPDASPLHRYFEWNNQRAAEGFRQLQAGRMTRTIMVHQVSGDQERSEPAFRPITVKVVASQQPAPVAAGTLALKTNGSAGAAEHAPSTVPTAPTATDAVSARTEPSAPSAGVAGASGKHGRPPEGGEVEVIERALMALEDWERRYQRRRSQPGFEAVFRPVFVAIAEARERSDGRI